MSLLKITTIIQEKIISKQPIFPGVIFVYLTLKFES